MRATKLLLLSLASVLIAGCPCLPSGDFTLTEAAGGYLVDGPYHFEGSLTRPAAAGESWLFTGRFVFPTPGYKVIQEIDIAESFPEQVHIRFSVLHPPPGPLPQVLDEVPVSAAIRVAPEATFRVSLETRCLTR